jgi:hypothetical protein
MNLYILVEGEKTEVNIYPKYISYLLPALHRVSQHHLAIKNNYYLMSGYGQPSIYKHLCNAIIDINNSNLYNYLVLCIDTEEWSIQDRKNEALNKIRESNVQLNSGCELVIITQKPCIETWFLGNISSYTDNPITQEFKDCSNYYNVSIEDPEDMGKKDFNTKAQFHKYYLSKMLIEKSKNFKKNSNGIRIRYNEGYTAYVEQEEYFKEIVKRVLTTNHCSTFKDFYIFFLQLKQKIT